MKALIRKLLGEKKTEQPVIVVSGLPRSGTSLMMKMLDAGGVPVVLDNVRKADEDNPKGYYEFERVKQLDKGDQEWVKDARGRVVKVISALLEHLPAEHSYKIIFMQRHIDEVLASQYKMLIRRGESPDKTSDEKMAELYDKHLAKVHHWLAQQPHMSVLEISYNQLLEEPQPLIQQIQQFLAVELDTTRMKAVVDPNLYRNRAQ